MVCNKCGAMQEFANEGLCRIEKITAQKTGFYTQYHISESDGLCSECYRKGKYKNA
jgi:Fe2+ or Zn2+ uptake regulation protein